MTDERPSEKMQCDAPPQTCVPVVIAAVSPRSNWPVIFGIGAILFGALGVITTLPAGCASSLATSLVPAGSVGSPAADVMQRITTWFTIGSLVSAGLSLLLLVLGVGLCQRRAWSIRLVWIWSVLNLGITVLAAAGAYIGSRQVLGSVQTHGQGMMMSLSDADAAKVAGALAIAVLVVGWSSPVFFLIWLARPNIRKEISQWP